MRIRQNFGSGEGNRIGLRRAKGSEEQRDQESEGGQESQGAMEDKGDGAPSLFLHQIIDFAPAHFALAPAPAQPVF